MNEKQNFEVLKVAASVSQNDLLVLTDASPLANFTTSIGFCIILIYFTGNSIARVHQFYKN
jgi:hypothetical protein